MCSHEFVDRIVDVAEGNIYFPFRIIAKQCVHCFEIVADAEQRAINARQLDQAIERYNAYNRNRKGIYA